MNSASFYCIQKAKSTRWRTQELPFQIHHNHLLYPEDHQSLGTAFAVSPYMAAWRTQTRGCFLVGVPVRKTRHWKNQRACLSPFVFSLQPSRGKTTKQNKSTMYNTSLGIYPIVSFLSFFCCCCLFYKLRKWDCHIILRGLLYYDWTPALYSGFLSSI